MAFNALKAASKRLQGLIWLNCRLFLIHRQAQFEIDRCIKQYNHIRPHQALNMRPNVATTTNSMRCPSQVGTPTEARKFLWITVRQTRL
ncbi:MAG TPA: hypothetical protein DCL95_16150 [Rhodospirillaceae bacterium]|nr:hypothetical protein [Rhodospirillaceae bacterium]HAJ21566.1 hypothetical protein [Rhodospirillaceae bacterium]HBM12954.1 hypothetical protein [Rhodospirillaceae bacterium]